MDIQAIRKLRLAEIVKEAGSNVEVAKRLDQVRVENKPMSESYVSRMLSPITKKGSKVVSNDMARAIEKAFGKPVDWMSTEPGAPVAILPIAQAANTDWPLSVPRSYFDALDPRTQNELNSAFSRMVMGAYSESIARAQAKQKAPVRR